MFINREGCGCFSIILYKLKYQVQYSSWLSFSAMANFEKCLTEVDVKKQMAIPSDFVQHLPNYEGGYTIFFPVHDVSGNIWEGFGYYIRSRDHNPYYPKPVFQGDWRKYVREKQLTPGDKIIFRVEENANNGAPRYIIAAQKKKIKLFGRVFWTEEF